MSTFAPFPLGTSGPRSQTAAHDLHKSVVSVLDGPLRRVWRASISTRAEDRTNALNKMRSEDPGLEDVSDLLGGKSLDPDGEYRKYMIEQLRERMTVCKGGAVGEHPASPSWERGAMAVRRTLAGSLLSLLAPDADQPRLMFTLHDITTFLGSLQDLDDAARTTEQFTKRKGPAITALPSWVIGDQIVHYLDETMEETMLNSAQRWGIDTTQESNEIRKQFLVGRPWATVGDKMKTLYQAGVLRDDTADVSALATWVDEHVRSRKTRHGEFRAGQIYKGEEEAAVLGEAEVHSVTEWKILTPGWAKLSPGWEKFSKDWKAAATSDQHK